MKYPGDAQRSFRSRKDAMTKLSAKLFAGAGILFALYSILLFIFAPLPMQVGMTINIFVFLFDCLWFAGTGLLLIATGVRSFREKYVSPAMIQAGGYLLIFSVVFLVTTLVFNRLAMPATDSNGRIVAFMIQSLPRLIRPSLSPDFLVPFMGIVVFVVAAVLFRYITRRRTV